MTPKFVATCWDNPCPCVQQGADRFHVLAHNGREKCSETCFHAMIHSSARLDQQFHRFRITVMRCMK